MPVRPDELRALIIQAANNSISRQELERLVQLSRIFAEAYIHVFRQSASVLCEKQGISITDLAIDSVGELFSRDTHNQWYHLRAFLEAWKVPAQQIPDHELVAGFRSLISRFVDYGIARLYAQADPAGSRIQRNIKECAKREGPFVLRKDVRGFVLFPRNSLSNEIRPPFPLEELSSKFLNLVRDSEPVPQLLVLLHQVVTSQTLYRHSIPLNDVVNIFRQAYHNDEITEAETYPDLDGLAEFEIDKMRKAVESVLKEKILFTYLAHRKVTKEEAEALFKACRDIITDWCNGKARDKGAYTYLRQYLPIDKETFAREMRVRMEYLVRIARNEFLARLSED